MWWIASLAHAACTFDASPTALDEAMDRALRSYADLDVPAFRQATTEVDYLVGAHLPGARRSPPPSPRHRVVHRRGAPVAVVGGGSALQDAIDREPAGTHFLLDGSTYDPVMSSVDACIVGNGLTTIRSLAPNTPVVELQGNAQVILENLVLDGHGAVRLGAGSLTLPGAGPAR